MVTTSDLANLSANVYQNSGAPTGWTRVVDFSRPDGFYGAVYQNSQGDTVAAIRGMQLTSSSDVATVAQVKLGEKPLAFDSAIQFYDFIQEGYGGDVTYTGHSLGGAEVDYIA